VIGGTVSTRGFKSTTVEMCTWHPFINRRDTFEVGERKYPSVKLEHSSKSASTRPSRPGIHGFELLIHGRSFGEHELDLKDDPNG